MKTMSMVSAGGFFVNSSSHCFGGDQFCRICQRGRQKRSQPLRIFAVPRVTNECLEGVINSYTFAAARDVSRVPATINDAI